MLNKPKFMSPSINMYGNTVIDLNSDTLPFSCIVDGNEAIIRWQIVVSKLEDNAVVFDSGIQERNTPFFPINNRNQNVVFNVNLKEYFVATAEVCYVVAESTYDPKKVYYSLVDGKYVVYEYNKSTWSTDYRSLYYTNFVNSNGAYYWVINLWGSSGSETQSVAEVFYANSIPETAIYYSYNNNFLDKDGNLDTSLILSTDENNMSVLTKRKIFLKASYSQNEGVSIKRYGWRLTDTSNGVVILDTITHNQIYGIEDDISCECNGLINKTNYLAELYIETQNGYFDILNSIKFNVDYTVKNIDADFEIMALNNTSGIMLNWGNLRTTEGIVVGDAVQYTTNFPIVSYDEDTKQPNGSVSIEIPENTSVVFSGNANGKELEIDENSYVILSFQFDTTQNATLFEMSGVDNFSNDITRKLTYAAVDRTLKYTVTKGEIMVYKTESLPVVASELCWYVVTLYPLLTDDGNYTDFKVIKSVANGGLFPIDESSTENEILYPESNLYPCFGEWDQIREENSSGV